METSLNRAAKPMTLLSLQTFHYAFARSFVHALLLSVIHKAFMIFTNYTQVDTIFVCYNKVLFSCA